MLLLLLLLPLLLLLLSTCRCAGFARPRPPTIDMCYSGGTFYMAEENPPCTRFTGSVSMSGKRRVYRLQ
jgi:hypothetical protein